MGSTEYLDNLPARRVVNDVGKSEYRIGAKGLKIVEELSARGCSVVTIAKALRMGRDAFRRCRDRQPEVLEALERGRAVEHDQLVGNLRLAANEGNVVANIFLLKARHDYIDTPLPPSVQVNVGAGVLVVPQRLSMEEFLEHEDIGPQRPETVERIPGERNFTPPESDGGS